MADWQAKSREQNRHSPETVEAFLKDALKELKRLKYVERFAWFSADPDSGPSVLPRSSTPGAGSPRSANGTRDFEAACSDRLWLLENGKPWRFRDMSDDAERIYASVLSRGDDRIGQVLAAIYGFP